MNCFEEELRVLTCTKEEYKKKYDRTSDVACKEELLDKIKLIDNEIQRKLSFMSIVR